MGNYLILAALAVIVVLAIRSGRKHLKGEGGCCGGSADPINVEKKQLQGPKIGERIVHIQGMKCDNCRKQVEKQLDRLDGVAAEVNWKKGIAVLSLSREVSDNEIRQALAWTEYTITSIETEKE